MGDAWTDIIRNVGAVAGGDAEKPDPLELQRGQMKKMELTRRRIASIVKDPATAEALKPYYHYFCKRPCFHDEFLQAFNRPNVTLVDTQGKGVERITPQGVIVAGKEYGTGSSRDWAAKGALLLGIRAVIVQSFERIHRSNLIGMGVLPLEYLEGADRSTFGLEGEEIYDITGIAEKLEPRMRAHLKATDRNTKNSIEFDVRVRIDTPNEAEYYRNGGILQYVLRQLLATSG